MKRTASPDTHSLTDQTLSLPSSEITANPANWISVAGQAITTTSLKVAEAFGKRHDNVVAKLQSLDCSENFRLLNFKETSADIEMPNGGTKKTPLWQMTKDGFMFLVMGFTGKRAAAIKEAYINAFNRMAEQLSPSLPVASPAQPALSVALRQTIDRKAQELSLQGYDAIRARLTEWAEQWQSQWGEEYAQEAIEDYDKQACEMVFVNAETLWNACAGIATMKVTLDLALSQIEALERETGRTWYNRV
jgi:Rha family phage regulatory protein